MNEKNIDYIESFMERWVWGSNSMLILTSFAIAGLIMFVSAVLALEYGTSDVPKYVEMARWVFLFMGPAVMGVGISFHPNWNRKQMR